MLVENPEFADYCPGPRELILVKITLFVFHNPYIMNFKEIEELYNLQDFENALTHAEIYLEKHPADIAVLCIKAKCIFELARLSQIETLAASLYRQAYDDFSTALESDPDLREALLYRAWLGAHVLGEHAEQAVTDSNRLIATNDDLLVEKAVQYRFQARLQLHDTDNAITDMEQQVVAYRQRYQEEQPLFHEHAFSCYAGIGDVWNYYRLSPEQALTAYRHAFEYAWCNDRNIFFAHFSLDHNDFDFAAKVMESLFTFPEGEEERLLPLLERTGRQLDEIVSHQALASAYCKGVMALSQVLFREEPLLEKISLGKKLLAEYPSEARCYHMIGHGMFEGGNYTEAISYYEKGFRYKAYPLPIVRWTIAKYETTGIFPETFPESDHDIPFDWYVAGCRSADYRQLTRNKAFAAGLVRLNKIIYGKAFEIYHRYWFEKDTNTKAANEHHFAMTCNNYGIALFLSGEYAVAAKVHTVGYDLSPFWEQLNSRADAWRMLGDYKQAVADYTTLLLEYNDTMGPVYYVAGHERLIDCCIESRDYDTALSWLEKILGEYDRDISKAILQLDENEQDTIRYNINRIRNSRAFIRNDKMDLTACIRSQEELLEQFPDDSNTYFVLMQLYFEGGSYDKCIGCANNRLSINDWHLLPPESQMKIYYFRGRAYARSGKYEAALRDMLQVNEYLTDHTVGTPIDRFGVWRYIAEYHFALGNLDQCINYAVKTAEINASHNWAWDQETADVYYYAAAAQEAKGDKTEARRTLRLLLDQDPGHVLGKQMEKRLKKGGLFGFLRW